MARLLLIALLGLACCSIALANRPPDPAIIERLRHAQTLVDEGDRQGALRVLVALEQRARPGSPEAILIVQQHAALLIEMDRQDEAQRLLDAALAEGAGDVPEAAPIFFTVGYLHALQGRYREADRALDRWLALTLNPTPQALFLAGVVKFHSQQHAEALPLLERAIAASTRVPASWIEVKVMTLLRVGRGDEANRVIRARLGAYPGEAQWWRLLVHLATERSRWSDAAVAMAVLDHAQPLDHADLLRLVDLLAAAGLPERAARVLQALREAQAEGNREHDMKQARLWLASREFDQAAQVLQQIARRYPDSEALRMLGQLHLHWERYEAAHEHLAEARRREGAQAEAETAWLYAVAAWNLGYYDDARGALEVARATPAYRQRADRLLAQLELRG